GEREEADRLARPLLARTTDPDRHAEISWQLCIGLLFSGRVPEGMTVIEQALARPGISGAWTARLLTRQALGHVYLGQPDEADQVVLRALAAAEQAGDQF